MKMEKIKFGVQLLILMLAFPVWFVTEMKQADQEMKKSHAEKQQIIDVKKSGTEEAMKKGSPVSTVTMVPGSKLMFVNI